MAYWSAIASTSLLSGLILAGCHRSTETSAAASADAATVQTTPVPEAPHYDIAQITQPNGGSNADALDSGGAPSGYEGSHTISVTTMTTTLGVAAPVAAPPDPYASTISSLRQRGVGCYSTLPAGSYSATMVMTVTAGGTVIDTNVDPGNVTDAPTLDCLRRLASSAVFPYVKDGGRNLRIDVAVVGR